MTVSQDYKDRVFKLFKNSPHTVALYEIKANTNQDMRAVAEYILAHLSIDTSEGQVLDWLASLIGVTRPQAQEPDIFTLRRMGEIVDLDNHTGFADDTDPTVETGGYLGSIRGMPLVSAPDTDMSDEDFRFLIRQKAASYRKKLTHENAFLYLLAFGSRCVIDEDEVLHVEFDPLNYYDLNAWEKNYVVQRGFKPGGVGTGFADMMRNQDSI